MKITSQDIQGLYDRSLTRKSNKDQLLCDAIEMANYLFDSYHKMRLVAILNHPKAKEAAAEIDKQFEEAR